MMDKVAVAALILYAWMAFACIHVVATSPLLAQVSCEPSP